jgi:hypothetical protein
MSYQVGLHRTVRACHVMPGMAGPAGQRRGETLAVRVWESPAASGGYRAPVGG